MLYLTHLLEIHYLKDYQDHNIYVLEVSIPFFGNRGSIALWISNFPPLFFFTNCVLIIPHDPHFAFNINLLFLDLTYVGSVSSVFFFFFYTINFIHYIKYPIYNFSCWSFEVAPSFKSSSNIAIPLFFFLLLSFPALIELIINSKRLKRSSGSL